MTEALRLTLEPFVGWWLLLSLTGLAALGWGVYLVRRGVAALSRALGLMLVCLVLANPTLVTEEREPLSSVVAIILDQSESMQFGERAITARTAYDALKARLSEDPALEVRTFETRPEDEETYLYTALRSLTEDVSRERIAGAILITDGQAHDLPGTDGLSSAPAPVHALIVGNENEADRSLRIVSAPDFGIVGESATLVIRADDPAGGDVPLGLSVNGSPAELRRIPSGQEVSLTVPLERRGENIIVLETPAGPQELTLANNRAAVTISGVRDRLRVLLVTGKPNQSGRVWRDLLKSDPSVDLVHFTILRPPFKTDYTSPDELSLIAFPTEELFERKLGEFDLVIFDQYERQGVITQSYLANMSRYVAEGGALLIVAGEQFAGPASLSRTPLASVLPAVPTGRIRTGQFRPELTQTGTRHAVTAPLAGRQWGGWMRFVEADTAGGDVLISGPQERPLLIVDRVAKGRVGMLMSDHIWLWASGYDGGGPFGELIRRLVHWMMKEPELEERTLTLSLEGKLIRAELRTLLDGAPPLQVETPSGSLHEPVWEGGEAGRFTASIEAEEMGVYRARSGGLEAILLSGPENPREYDDLSSTMTRLQPLVEATGGGLFRLDEDGQRLPEIRRVGPGQRSLAGPSWMGLREQGAYTVRSASGQSLLPGILAGSLILLFLFLAWRREGR